MVCHHVFSTGRARPTAIFFLCALCVSALISDPEPKALFQPDLVALRDDATLRREYIHQSHVDREDSTPERRWVAHYPDPSGRRRVFYNEPDKAVVPGKKQKTKAEER